MNISFLVMVAEKNKFP